MTIYSDYWNMWHRSYYDELEFKCQLNKYIDSIHEYFIELFLDEIANCIFSWMMTYQSIERLVTKNKNETCKYTRNDNIYWNLFIIQVHPHNYQNKTTKTAEANSHVIGTIHFCYFCSELDSYAMFVCLVLFFFSSLFFVSIL